MPPQNRQLTRRLQLAVAVLVTVLNAATAAASEGAAGAVDPYGAHDAGGFLNVLTPGEAGSDNAAQLALFELNGTRPAHFADQAPLYEGLLGAAPSLTDSNLGNYFKDATFGVRPGKVESSISPEPGLTVLRDSQYGVPHVYGKTRAEVMYGAGYAAAQDRLFMMDVLRHTARAQLSSFVGGDPANRQMDRDVWAQAPYTQKDLHRQIAAAPRLYGAAGRAVIRDGRNYVAGVNAFIDKARTDATLLPSEYAAIGKLPAPWHLTDSVAEASLIGIEQGQGGGGELNSALTEQAFERRFGKRAGRRSWLDFRERNDPESPTTVSRRFPYRNGDPFAPRGLAMPDVGSVSMTPPGPPLKSTAKATATPTGGSSGLGASIGRALLHSIHNSGADSNALLVRSGESNTGHPIAVMGPQVDYYSPEILMEEDLHGPGIDARGAAFPGVNQYVQLGHGRDYAWS
ncbi:MAG: hypothetical protein QOJ01_926, partial [Solirubrobacterales bacterium]|nr:hypothetical protein [Solirubrobacterales bacterium]